MPSNNSLKLIFLNLCPCKLLQRGMHGSVFPHICNMPDISSNQLQESFMSLLYNTINQTAHEAAISDIWISDTLLLFGSVHTSFMSLLYHFCEESFCVDSTFVVSQLLFIFTLINNTERWKLQFSFLFFAKETFSALFSLQL